MGFAFYRARMSASVLGPSAGIGVSLATPGLFGLPAFVIFSGELASLENGLHPGADRTRGILWLVVRRGVCWLPWGTGIGLGAGSLVKGMLYDVPVRDPFTFTAISIAPRKRTSAIQSSMSESLNSVRGNTWRRAIPGPNEAAV
jgi:hypothetical protein